MWSFNFFFESTQEQSCFSIRVIKKDLSKTKIFFVVNFGEVSNFLMEDFELILREIKGSDISRLRPH